MIKVKIKRTSKLAVLPTFSYPGDAGMDLHSIENTVIAPNSIQLIHTGLIIELPPKTEAQIRPRSGLALNNGITVLNSPGTIDEGYRGEIGVILINHGTKSFYVTEGMKIAQLVVKPILSIELEEVDDVSNSERGKGGFGSSGLNEH